MTFPFFPLVPLSFYTARQHPLTLPLPVSQVVWVDLLEKTIGLSAAPHVTNLTLGPSTTVKDGDVIEKTTVIRVDPGLGMLVGWGDAGALGDAQASLKKKTREVPPAVALTAAGASGAVAFVHNSRVSDAPGTAVERVYRVGDSARVRIIGLAGIDTAAAAAAAPSIVNAQVLRPSDVRPGDDVVATVISLASETDEDLSSRLARGHGIVARVSLGAGVRGALYALHMGDVLPSRALGTRKARRAAFLAAGLVAGSPVNARALAVDEQGRVSLTLRKSMLAATRGSTDAAIIASAADAIDALAAAPPGTPVVAPGFVSAVRENALIISFFGGAHGTVHADDLVRAGILPEGASSEATRGALASLYRVGTPFRARILGGGPAPLSIRISAQLTGVVADGGTASASGPASALPPVGTLVAGTVVATPAPRTGATVLITQKKGAGEFLAEVPLAHLPGGLSNSAAVLASAAWAPGAKVKGLLMFAHRTLPSSSASASSAPVATVSARAELISARARIPTTLDSLTPRSTAVGLVQSVAAAGAFVRFGSNITGLLPRVVSLAVGDVVDVTVTRVIPSSDAGGSARLTLALTSTPALPAGEASRAVGQHRDVSSIREGDAVPFIVLRSKRAGKKSTDDVDDGDDADGNDGDDADGNGSDEGSDDEAARSSTDFPPLRVRLSGVTGEYSARLSVADCFDFSFATGAVGGESKAQSVSERGRAQYKALVRAAGSRDTRLSATVIRISTVSSRTTLMLSVRAVSSATPPATPAVGAFGWGVVECGAKGGDALWVALGGGVRVRVPVREAADDDAVRDAATGRLRPGTPAVATAFCEALSLRGALVPVVITGVKTGGAGGVGVLEASVRLARAARDLRVASGASRAESVSLWLRGAAYPGAPMPPAGTVILARLSRRGGRGGDIDAAVFWGQHDIPASIDVAAIAERASWTADTVHRARTGALVVCGVVLPGGGARGSTGSLSVALRPTWLSAASAPGETATTAAATLKQLVSVEASAVSAVGARVSGFVTGVSSAGVFVRLSPGVTARVALNRATDKFVTPEEVSKNFAVGSLVTGVVMGVTATGGVEFSLRRKESRGATAPSADASLRGWADLKVGDLAAGVVTKVADFGIFIALNGTARSAGARAVPISGLCHVSEVEDVVAAAAAAEGGAPPTKKRPRGAPPPARRGALGDRFSAGDSVRVVITAIDMEKKTLALSMRPSRIESASAAAQGEKVENDEDDDDDDDDDDDEDDDDVDEEDDDDDEDGDLDDDEDEDLDDDEDDDEDGDEDIDYADRNEDDDDNDDDSDDDGEPAEAKRVRTSTSGIFSTLSTSGATASASSAPRLPATVGAAARSGPKKAGEWSVDALLAPPKAGGDAGSVSSEGGSSDSSADGKGKRKSRASKRAARDVAEAETARLEARVASGEALSNPSSLADFERLVVAAPTAPETWIRFMAWALSTGDIAGARALADRGLAAVPTRDEAARLAIWTALLNLEVTAGDSRSLSGAFARAIKGADARAVHCALASSLSRAGPSRHAELDALHDSTTRKFGSSASSKAAAPAALALWTAWAEHRFEKGDAAGARALLKRALGVLPAAAHADAVVAFAVLEYRFARSAGDAARAAAGCERARTMLDGLLAAAPKRLDVWNVFLDQETAAVAAGLSTVPPVRSLFQRAAAARLSSKKMQFLLKKWLSFETAHGDAAGVAAVKAVAQRYVDAAVGGGDNDDDDA